MAIDYNTTIATGLYAGSVATDAAYQVPGTFGVPATFEATAAGKRLLTFVEVFRSYLSQCDNTHEAKLLHVVTARMLAAMEFGTHTWNTTTMPVDAQKAALRYLAGHVIPTDV